jgi:predicted unusual protein kinase regulating ubiquinone biosynthesis (AarF/ABC1/UbiB family)
MPHFSLGRLDKYPWNRSNFDTFKNVLKHISCSLLHAYETTGFVHNDAHFGNILLRKTKIETIQYGDDVSLRVIGGILPVIVDLEKSFIDESNEMKYIRNMYSDISRVFNLASSEIAVKSSVDETLPRMINDFAHNFRPISKDLYKTICDEIDKIYIKFMLSEMELPPWLQPRKV